MRRFVLHIVLSLSLLQADAAPGVPAVPRVPPVPAVPIHPPAPPVPAVPIHPPVPPAPAVPVRPAAPVPCGLRCEELDNPKGIDAVSPRLSWRLEGEGNDIVQTAWQILVASSPELLALDHGDLWTSPRTKGDRSLMIAYRGSALKSGTCCYWKVRVWTNAGVTAWSRPARWSTGLLSSKDWKARWIGYDAGFPWDSITKFSRLSARYFRKQFHSPGAIKKATLYIAGLGHYIVAINGHRIGDQVLAESPTDYTRSVKYNSFDVTADCTRGVNAIGVVLGNGRYFTMRPIYKPKKIKEFGYPKLLLQLDLEDAQGHHHLVVSDSSWRFTADGPIRTNNEYDGEEYDATKEFPGWTRPGFDDSGWMPARYALPPGGRLSAQQNPPLKIMRTVAPLSVRELRPGVWIVDMGQNMAGWLQLRVRGERGKRIVLRYAETLRPDGALYTANLRDAKATDSYTLKGEGEEVWHPVFVFHGFRYVSVTGWPQGAPATGDFEGDVVYDDLPATGRIATSDTLLNHIIRNAWWGINSNYKGMPIDCPQRNERMPWLGDRATGSLGESYLFDNETLYAKWLDDIQESQKPDGALPDVAPAYWNYYSDNMTWPGTYLLVADMLYEQFGDLGAVRRHYASMRKWLAYMRGRYEKGGLMLKDKYGDWCVPPESPLLIHTHDSARMTDGRLIATAYYYHFLRLMAKFAGLIGRHDEYTAKAEVVKVAFNRQFLHDDGYGNNSVTSDLLPLCFDMVPRRARAAVASRLLAKVASDGHIATGVIGTGWLMCGLTELGRADLSLRLAVNKDYPGWGYMVEHGATTIWELWNGNTADPAMNSQNHVMLLGDLLTWCFRDLAGIAPDEPGYKKIRMQPVFPAGLDSVSASYRTPYGIVTSEWRREGGNIRWQLTVPPNTRAIVRLPDGRQTETGSGTYQYDILTKGSI
ncbi:MAG TPA: glycoside hydrolase family 78 protein [Puia sp.]|nr:glycoside hydrolase family 78 protein [Puia sp.]